ncbi:hypothetical protein ACWEQ0_28780, partial [Nocardia thailandica]
MATGRMVRVLAAASVLAGCALLGPAVAFAAPDSVVLTQGPGNGNGNGNGKPGNGGGNGPAAQPNGNGSGSNGAQGPARPAAPGGDPGNGNPGNGGGGSRFVDDEWEPLDIPGASESTGKDVAGPGSGSAAAGSAAAGAGSAAAGAG